MTVNGQWNASLKETSSYQTRFVCIDCLSKNEIKVEIYPSMALLIKTDDCWRVCYFSLIRDVGNIKGTFILEPSYTRKGHKIYIRFVDKIKICFNFDNSWCKVRHNFSNMGQNQDRYIKFL